MKIRIIHIIIFMLPYLVIAQKMDAYKNSKGAIKGFDPVAYFDQNKPVKGSEDFAYGWMGAEWCFVNEKNQETFMRDPLKYIPQYGGYCAYSMAKGKLSKTDPQVWTIVDNKLYLIRDQKHLEKWKAYKTNYIRSADKNWSSLNKN